MAAGLASARLFAVPGQWLPSIAVPRRVERYGSRATVSFESLHIRIPLKFCQNSAKLSQFFRNSENFRTSQHFLECSAKFRKKKSSKSVQNSMKIVEKSGFLQKSEQKCEKSLTNFCEDFEFGAVRRCALLGLPAPPYAAVPFRFADWRAAVGLGCSLLPLSVRPASGRSPSSYPRHWPAPC